jgi:hypothetical protein
MKLDNILNFDALNSAEEMTGESYKTDKKTEDLGLSRFFAHNKLKEKILT